MPTDNRKYPIIPNSGSADVPYHVNAALRSVDEDVQKVAAGVAAEAQGYAEKIKADAEAAEKANRAAWSEADARAVGEAKTYADKSMVAFAARSDFLTGADTRAARELDPGSGWAETFTSASGRVAGGFTDKGVFRLAQPLDAPLPRPSRVKVVCKGDSLVRGYTGSAAWPIEDAWPAHLAKLLPGVEIVNAGYGGNTVDDLRFRTGAMDLYAEIEGGTIPASGPVKAIVRQRFGLAESRDNAYYGTLAGVNGSLDRSVAGAWTFTRASAGTAVPAPGRQLLARADLYPSETALIWVGRNDVSYNSKGREADLVEHVLASVEALVEHTPAHKRQFGVVSILNRVDEPAGTEKHRTVLAINAALAARFPGRFLNLRPWLVNQAIYDAGMTPTTADLASMSKDAPPPQIMDDGSHYVKAIAPLLAAKFEEYLTEKGYC